NGDGCHEAVGLKRVHHINSTDRMHHQGELMTHDEPFFMAPDDKHDLMHGALWNPNLANALASLLLGAYSCVGLMSGSLWDRTRLLRLAA
ncbi:hypothetical protein ACU6QO_04665, partial [Aeromonas veronii]|uniref:hypothetical protein n=1 Tax=Aeromonas veronii TaxID=654 RepID=UPI00406CA9B5